MLHRSRINTYKSIFKTRNPAHNIQKSVDGFTLLEILIAIFIFSIVVTTIFASYNSVFTGTESIDRTITTFEMAKNCLNRIVFDLNSTYIALPPQYTPPDFDTPPNPYRVVGNTVYIKSKDFPRLRFTSLSHMPFRGKVEEGIAEIVYYVQETESRGYVLRRADSLYPYQPFEENNSHPVLCEAIKSLSFKFYDQEEIEYDLWDSEAEDFGYATPTSIGIKLELDNGSGSQLFETKVTLPVHRAKEK